MDSIRLQDAYLCECGMITANAKRCVCGNEHGLLSLSSALNREPGPVGEGLDRIACAVGTLELALMV